jgi:hypothetical protein
MGRAMFGRQTELALVSGLLDAVSSGPAALILGGEAGIGKSTLWLEALSQARARSYRVLSCRPNESEAKLSFAALGDLLEGVVDESLERLPPPQRSALEVALLRKEAIGSPPISGRFRVPFTERSWHSPQKVRLWSRSTTLSGWTLPRLACWSSRFGV